MQQPCKKCGYESPEADRFCRQCGEQLSAESEFTPTMTFNQVRAETNPPVASVGTGRFPPSVSDTIGGATERYYSAPQYASAPVALETLHSYAPPKPTSSSWFKSFSRFMKGTFAFLLVVALVVTTSMAVKFSSDADHERWRNRELEERARNRAGRETANGRAQNAWEQMEEALILAKEASDKASSAGATLTIGDEKSIDLDRYAFPNGEIEAKITKPGDEALSQTTRQNLDAVQNFYEKMFGKPVLQVEENYTRNDRRPRKILFQSSTQPPVLVKVEELIDQGKVKITILRSFIRYPRFGEVQAHNLR